MLDDTQPSPEALIAEFFEALKDWWTTERTAMPRELDLGDDRIRRAVLPLAVLETRENGQQLAVADLIDLALARIIAAAGEVFDAPARAVIRDLESNYNAICYVGFRRAEIISAPRALAEIRNQIERAERLSDGGGRFSAKAYAHLVQIAGLARARFDAQERFEFEDLAYRALGVLQRHSGEHASITDIHQLIRWFAYPGRLQPKTYSRIQPLALKFGEDYFAKGREHVPGDFAKRSRLGRVAFHARAAVGRTRSKLAGKTDTSDLHLVKEVAVATAIGRPEYGTAVFLYLQGKLHRAKNEAEKQKLRTKLVEIAYVAGADEFYGQWLPLYRKYLLENPDDTYSSHIATVAQRFGESDRAITMLRRHKRGNLSLRILEANLLRYSGRFKSAGNYTQSNELYVNRSLVSRLAGKGRDRFATMQAFWAGRAVDEMDYIRSVEELMAVTPREKTSNDLVVICPSSFNAFTQMPVHALAELRARGCSVISLLAGVMVGDKVSRDIDANVRDAIYPHYLSSKATKATGPSAGWIFEPEQERIEFKGLNFDYTLHNTMGIIFRCYDVEWRNPVVLGFVRRYQTAIESMFDVYARLSKFSASTGRGVKVILTEIQQGISHAFRLIAEKDGGANGVELFHICNGFEAYHSDLVRTNSAQFQCLANISRHPEVSLAYRPSIHVYRDWVAKAPEELKATPAALAYAARVDATAATKPYGGELKYPGRPVIVLLGKILPDLARPNDHGFIHKDVKEWLIDCCEFAYKNKINLLVKPHPDETKSRVSLYVNQTFVELLDNVRPEARPVVMDSQGYPIPTLRDWADGVIMWGGNSSVELGLLGIPSMICGYYGSMDVPVGHVTPDNREKFEAFLSGQIDRERLAGVRRNTITFLSYVLNANHTMPSRFNNRSMYNAEVWPPRLNEQDAATQTTARRMADYILGDADAIRPPESAAKETASE